MQTPRHLHVDAGFEQGDTHVLDEPHERHAAADWHCFQSNVSNLARHLVDKYGYSVYRILEYLDEPHKYTDEWNDYNREARGSK